MKTYRSLFAAVALFSASAFAAPALDCQAEPGAQLCRTIRVMQSYLVGCSGGCEDLFARQTRYFNRVADIYYGNVDPGTAVAADLNTVAHKAADKICRYRWLDMDPSTLSGLIAGANRALGALKEIQQLAGSETVRFCRIVER